MTPPRTAAGLLLMPASPPPPPPRPARRAQVLSEAVHEAHPQADRQALSAAAASNGHAVAAGGPGADAQAAAFMRAATVMRMDENLTTFEASSVGWLCSVL